MINDLLFDLRGHGSFFDERADTLCFFLKILKIIKMDGFDDIFDLFLKMIALQMEYKSVGHDTKTLWDIELQAGQLTQMSSFSPAFLKHLFADLLKSLYK